MSNPEYPGFDDFDVLTAGLEVEMVTDELGIMALIIRDYPKLKSTYTRNMDELMRSPTDHFVQSEETRIATKKNLPALAKVIYQDDF